MTVPQVDELFEFWREFPPEHELLRVWVMAATTWEPAQKLMTELERQAEHRKSLERRWASGQYMNPKQMWEALGGRTFTPSKEGGILVPVPGGTPLRPDEFPGIGPFPGAH